MTDPSEPLSPYRIRKLRRCPLKFRRHYIDRDRPPPRKAEAMQAGRAVHAAIEAMAIARLEAFHRTYDRAILEAPIEEDELLELAAGSTTLQPDALDLVVEASAWVRRRLSFQGLMAVEKEVDCAIGGVQVRGRIDLLYSRPDGIDIWDLKVTSRPPNRREVARDEQCLIYLSWARQRWPGSRPRFTLCALGASAVTIPWSPDIERKAALLCRGARNEIRRRLDEEHWPARPRADCTRCPYAPTCEPWKRYRQKRELPEDPARALLEARTARAAAEEAYEEMRDRVEAMLGPGDELRCPIGGGKDFRAKLEWRAGKAYYEDQEAVIDILSAASDLDPLEVMAQVSKMDAKRVGHFLETLPEDEAMRVRMQLDPLHRQARYRIVGVREVNSREDD